MQNSGWLKLTWKQKELVVIRLKKGAFHRIGPLGRFDLVVEKSVHEDVCLSPFHAILPGEQRRSQGSKGLAYRLLPST